MTTATKTSKTKTDSVRWLDEHTPAVRGVYAALAAHPGSTAAELADLASVGRSTATKALATMEAAGHVKRTSIARTATGRRTPDNWQTTATKTTTTKRTPKAPAKERVSSARTSTPPPAAPAAATPAARASRGTTSSTAPTPPVPAPTSPPVAVPEGKLRNGQLTQLVMDQLHAAPANEWTVRDLWKILDRSQGAISNALERATIKGTAVRTCEAPRRYRLIAPPAAPPSEPTEGELVAAGAPSPRRGRPRRARS